MKKISILTIVLFLTFLSGCNLFDNSVGKMKSAFKGREATIRTYDENSQIIDTVQGKSIDIQADDKFEIKDSKGNTLQKSGVLSLTVGGKTMIHVGSSLILSENGLTDVLDEYAKTTDITSHDRSTPFVNRMIHSMKNITSGQDLVLLIRSQTGKPLATYVGKDVSYFSTDIDKSTGFIIDGKYLFVYRCDYTIYDLALLK